MVLCADMILFKRNATLRERQLKRFRLAMLAPGLVLLFAINLLPILDTLKTSFYDYYLPRPEAVLGITLNSSRTKGSSLRLDVQSYSPLWLSLRRLYLGLQSLWL